MNKTRLFALIAALLGVGGCQEQQQAEKQEVVVEEETAKTSPKEQKPNIVFIFADDMGYGDLSCYGNEKIETQHLDSLARGGIRFTDFYAASPVCSPSRAGLMTGRYPYRMGICNVFFPESWTGMDTSEITIADQLKQQGYATGCIGKWHLGHHRHYLPLQRGFDEYFGLPYSNDMDGLHYLRGNFPLEKPVDQATITKNYTREAKKFITKHKDEPFFLYFAHNMPHIPVDASKQFKGSSEGGLYGDVIEEIDWSAGEIAGHLEKLGLDENTLFVFSSDNGPWLVFEERAGTAGPLRAGKSTTFEGGVRVPTLAYWPGTIPKGQVDSSVATMMDWFPTFTELAGGQLPDDRPIDGQNLMPVLTDQGELSEQEFFYFHDGELQAYRNGDWKVKKAFEGYEGKPWKKQLDPHPLALFNLKQDIGEQNNMAQKFSEKASAMKATLEEFDKEMDRPECLEVRRQGYWSKH